MRRLAVATILKPIPPDSPSPFLADVLVFVVFAIAGVALMIKLLMPPIGGTGSGAATTRDGGTNNAASDGDTTPVQDDDKNASAFDLWLQNNPVLVFTATGVLAIWTGFKVSSLVGDSASETLVGGVIINVTRPGGRLKTVLIAMLEIALFTLVVFEFSPGDSTNWPAIGLSLFSFFAGVIWRLYRAQRVWRQVNEKKKEYNKGEALTKQKRALVVAANEDTLVDHLSYYASKVEFLVRVKQLAPFLIKTKLADLEASLATVTKYSDAIDKISAFEGKNEANLIDAFLAKNDEASDAVDTAMAVNSVYHGKNHLTNRFW